MIFILLPTLLGVTLMLPRMQALTCQSGTLMSVVNASTLPLQWTAPEIECEDGWGCQDMLMVIENEPKALVVAIKGCTLEKDHDVRVTQHRTGPGLSIVSYTHVCREKLCNLLSTTLPVWTSSPSTGPESSVRCPVCLSTEGCESATELKCPVGHTHCYNGVLQLKGENILTNVRVQGCMPQAACDLLNQTQKIGPLSVRENCDSNAFLTCQQGIMLQTKPNLTEKPIQWNALRSVMCDLEEVCQETLLLIDVGPSSLIVGSKGCSSARTRDSQTVTIHSAPPGVLVASYAHFCSSSGCNKAQNSSVLLNSLPHPASPAPGDLQCPACVGFHGSCTTIVTCPNGTSHCYSGSMRFIGSKLSATVNIQGCVAHRSSSLLNRTNNIGDFNALENSGNENEPTIQGRAGAAPAPYLAWVVGLGLSLALWCGVPSLLAPFPHEP
ncbi:PREDICTED: CD177 antigen isoform X2 [Hipposideros armiger]|uniref:CD177 antigen isoform X1 n=1 Tax=Hipposideros armiger TaxID=186990 RepID=A0A8B7QPN6_HIPAR|nr:PREDICTED: CD177 antigen isoform X1 [Hipposideros armiger]XP_019490172.1 PREDICTED: CD177 antigen isoform X2 [Hipposideros armiger]